jgi:large subunit ribosomal protein L13
MKKNLLGGCNMKSYVAKPLEIERKWYVIDATDKTLGRLSSEIAKRLRGKHKPIYTPHVDCGDHIIVINAEKVKLTGNKETQKVYRHHTGYMGGLRERSYKEMLAKHPERIIEKAVKGMLPKNSLGRQMYTKLKVYAGPEHNHAAQKPEVLDI